MSEVVYIGVPAACLLAVAAILAYALARISKDADLALEDIERARTSISPARPPGASSLTPGEWADLTEVDWSWPSASTATPTGRSAPGPTGLRRPGAPPSHPRTRRYWA